MGKGTEILRAKSQSDAQQIDRRLAGFSPEDLVDLAGDAVKALPEASRSFHEKLDPATSRPLRVLMVNWLDAMARRSA